MAGQFDPQRIPPGAKLELYISPSCPYCRQAMAFYDSAGIAYTTHDAQNDSGERARMFSYTGGDPTVPAIVMDGVYRQSGWGTPLRG